MKTLENNGQATATKANNESKNAQLSELTPATDIIAQNLGLTVDHMTTWRKRNYYYYRDETGQDIKNDKGEHIIIEVSHCDDPGGRGSLPALWQKNGYTSERLATYWSVDTYVYNEAGDCYRAYNPQEKLSDDRKRYVINFKWMFTATEANFEKLLKETLRRFRAGK